MSKFYEVVNFNGVVSSQGINFLADHLSCLLVYPEMVVARLATLISDCDTRIVRRKPEPTRLGMLVHGLAKTFTVDASGEI